MQSFILDRHTDPSNPTMKVTQDDKIPIYDSKADAEADLANIEEGAIVATKDTGATEKVVDVVQDGNMNPVTSNAVFDAINVPAVVKNWTFKKAHVSNTVNVNFTDATAHFTRAMMNNVANNETIISIYASGLNIPIIATSRFDSNGATLWSPGASGSVEVQIWCIVQKNS